MLGWNVGRRAVRVIGCWCGESGCTSLVRPAIFAGCGGIFGAWQAAGAGGWARRRGVVAVRLRTRATEVWGVGLLIAGRAGRLPDCQRRRICSRRRKMRAKMAAMAAAMAADRIVVSALGVVGGARKPANWSANVVPVSIGVDTN